jgi:hypothetical protein
MARFISGEYHFMNVNNINFMQKDVRVNKIGHSGYIYLNRPNFFLIYIIFLALTPLVFGVTHIEVSGGLYNWVGAAFGLPMFLSTLTYFAFNQIQRQDIWLITDEENYLVFLLTTNSKPVDAGLITKIKKNVFHSWNPVERTDYHVLKVSDFNNMASPNLFWINGKRVHMEYWKGSRGLPHKFISTPRQQDFLEEINLIYQRIARV